VWPAKRTVRDDNELNSMTLRSFLLGLLLSAALALAIPYSDLVMKGTWVGLTAFPVASFFLFLVLSVGVNPLLARLGKQLTRAELLTVFVMLLVAAGIPSFGLVGLLIPYIAGPFYFAGPENRWDELILPNLPKWLHPGSEQAVIGLYEGAPSSPIPWSAWWSPVLGWGILIAGVYLVLFGLSALLRRQWVENEKLVFPLVQLPVQFAEVEAGHRWALPTLVRNKLMWWCFLLPFCLHTLNGLHFHFPFVPAINVHLIPLGQYFTGKPWDTLQLLRLRVLFSIIGLTFLLPTNLSFSLWFFYFFFLVQQLLGAMAGFPMPNVQAFPVKAFVAHQMIGGIVVAGLYGFWGMRPHLRQWWECVLGRQRDYTAKEALSARGTLLCLVAGMATIIAWGGAAGAGAGSTTVLFVLFFLVHTVAVRLVCEGGMLYVQHPFRPINMLFAAVGSKAFGPARVTMLVFFDHLLMLDNRSPLMPCLVQGLKIGDMAGIQRRRLLGAMAASVVVAAAVSYWSYMRLVYANGGLTLNTWFTTYYTKNLYCSWTANLLVNGEPRSLPSVWTMLAGAGSMVFIQVLHRTFLWWPFHPIGYLMGATWPMVNFWFAILLGWTAKSAVMKYGGSAVYRQVLPGAFGLILGEFVSAGLWVLIDFAVGVRGHEIFSF